MAGAVNISYGKEFVGYFAMYNYIPSIKISFDPYEFKWKTPLAWVEKGA